MTISEEKIRLREDFKKEFPKYRYLCRNIDDFKKGEWVNSNDLCSWFESKLTQARKEERREYLRFLKRLKLVFDVCVCECGERWSETDGADLVKEELSKLKE